MAVTRTFVAGSEQFSQQIDHIIKSHSLRGSESLCKLLQYLAKQSLSNPEAPLKEYQIATEVYGRHADFDPQSDSTIRVQAGRLRLKLAEYYASEGASDPIVVRIPKGSYHLVFEPREVGPQPQLVPRRRLPRPPRWSRPFQCSGASQSYHCSHASSSRWSCSAASCGTRRLSRRKLPPYLCIPARLPVRSLHFWRPFPSGGDEPG